MKNKAYTFMTNGEESTGRAGELLAHTVKGVICIEGDLGSGKTVLARGIARGLGIDEYITSPTFNIFNVYEKDEVVFNHMDAYRITDPEMLYDIGFDEMVESGDVTVIEWADLISEGIGEFALWIKMVRGASEGSRILMLEGDPELIDEIIRRRI